MSDLENRAKPAIEPLLEEAPASLDTSQQATVAIWAIKTAMVLEALRSDKPLFFTVEERAQMREAQSPPPRTAVWIARAVGHSVTYCSAVDLTGEVDNSGERVKAYVTTMVFGPLAIQVMHLALPAAHTQKSVTASLRPGPWDKVAVRVWPEPGDTVRWPLAMGLSGEMGIDAFGDRWRPEKPSMSSGCCLTTE
jgi:hypothetical protein